MHNEKSGDSRRLARSRPFLWSNAIRENSVQPHHRKRQKISASKFLRSPIPDKNIRLVRLLPVAVRSPHELLAIGREHGEAVEAIAVSNALQSAAVQVHHPQFEISF